MTLEKGSQSKWAKKHIGVSEHLACSAVRGDSLSQFFAHFDYQGLQTHMARCHWDIPFFRAVFPTKYSTALGDEISLNSNTSFPLLLAFLTYVPVPTIRKPRFEADARELNNSTDVTPHSHHYDEGEVATWQHVATCYGPGVFMVYPDAKIISRAAERSIGSYLIHAPEAGAK